ncbi:QRFP-like peptide receptor [Nematostella vectensis]|uniref:QRFP-like peptide receptor n=1 Tax=Nematostella vectensis TaxID=45351 RepID=UPI0020770E03|nr:QRFP-like peptide receptor [Nematostella vectensis]XP_032238267.2 QRFP-like peptide receptor [Nematostella vectensis]XP_032238268.2 QRFP-like peptide receptor [Nematostella vectensis]XP_032238269.2 QRFP-like peptide receptor [Nematostella vectensis]XP_032238270.2 QRFP-like peptide receptor [Nematostella vectensis]
MSTALETPGNHTLVNLSFYGNNSLENSCPNLEENFAVRVGVITLYVFMFLTSILGNCLILVTVYRTQRMRTAVNLFIANMAISDIIQPVFGVPRVVVEVLYGRETWLIGGAAGAVLCKLAYFAQDVSLSVSIFSIVGITTERFYAVMQPLKISFLKSHVQMLLPLTWVIAVIMHGVYFDVFRIRRDHVTQMIVCYQHWASPHSALIYYSVFLAGLFLWALLAIAIMYSIIIVKLRRSRGSGHAWVVRKSREVQERKILQVALVITIVFFACFMPQVILVIVAPLDVWPHCSIEVLRFVTKVMEHSYTAFNPLICLIFSQNYREGFIRVFLSSCGFCTYPLEDDTGSPPGVGKAVKRSSDGGHVALTPLTLRESLRLGMTAPSMSSPALMRAEGVVMNK